jgi:hypothetical protein
VGDAGPGTPGPPAGSPQPWGEIWHDDGAVIPLLRDRIFARRDPADYTDLDRLYAAATGI